MYLYILSGK